MYQLLTGKLPFWPDKSLAQVAELPAYELLAAVRTFEVRHSFIPLCTAAPWLWPSMKVSH